MEIKTVEEKLLDLIVLCLERKLIFQVGGEAINTQNYLTTDYFTFVLQEHHYNVTFKEKFYLPGKQVEFIRRGSNFIKSLLRCIFNNYNLLYIFNATSNFTIKNVVMPPTIHGMVFQAKEIIGDAGETQSDEYQYQINFLVDIRDTFTGFTTNKKLISGLSIKYKGPNSEPIYYAQDFSYMKGSSQEEEFINLKSDTLFQLKELTDRLKVAEEKEKILGVFQEDINSDFYKYIKERDEVARSRNLPEISFEYNITPITIYAIKPRKTLINYLIRYGSYVGSAEIVYNHTGEIKYQCPNCKTDLKTKFVFAKKKHAEDAPYFVACTECASRLDSRNSVYSDDGWYLNEEISKCYRIIEDQQKTLQVLKSDIGICEIERCEYYKEDLVVYDFMKTDKTWLPNESGYTVNKKYVSECKNCHHKIVDLTDSVLYQVGDKDNAACYFCVDKNKDERIRKEFILSEISHQCFPANTSKICSNCGKIIGDSEKIICEGCKDIVCPECHNNNLCVRCGTALKSDLSITKFKDLWRGVKNNIMFFERKRKKMNVEMHNYLHNPDINELRIVLRSDKHFILYYFHICKGKYIYKRRKKI